MSMTCSTFGVMCQHGKNLRITSQDMEAVRNGTGFLADNSWIWCFSDCRFCLKKIKHVI